MRGNTRLLAWLLTILLAVVVLLSCAPALPEGEVIDKRYHSAWTEYRTETHHRQRCTGSGDARRCYDEPYTDTHSYYHPERWELVIRGENVKSQIVTRSFDVPRATWEGLKVGDTYRTGEA